MKKSSYLTTLIYLLLTLTLISCRNNPPSPTPSPVKRVDPTLINTQWRLTEINGESFPTNIMITMNFTESGVEGYLICNDWSNFEDFTINDEIFNIPKIIISLNMCRHDTLKDSFIENLTTEAKSYTLSESQLLIQDESNDTIMIFTPTEYTETHWPLPFIRTDSIDDISFTHIVEPWGARTNSTITGVLIETNGCLRLDTNDESFYLIWPQNNNITIEEQVQIVSSDGAIWATVGDTLKIDGFDLYSVDSWGDLVPSGCDGPYFVVFEKVAD